MDPATRYTLRRNTASIIKIRFFVFFLLQTLITLGVSGLVETPSISRASTASGRSSSRHFQPQDVPEFPRRPMTSSSVSTIGDDYLLETGRHLNETLETIQEEE